ncbi:MAG: phosphoenolpyruvate carboxykinase (GTP), partial [Oscillospiraceae bacterium]|nr:phosphoenolpyruvate carboxykinase (GTP) [Oscillospiraceae bacterium]
IFNVNWFRTDEEGHFIWPGFGDNLRVLEWIMKRCFNEIDADTSPIGFLPRPEDINLEDSCVDEATLRGLLNVDPQLWKQDAAGIRQFYEKFGDKIPAELSSQLEALERRLEA